MEKIHTIFIQPLEDGVKGELGIDDEANLYWNKKAIVTKQKITLQWWVHLAVILASLSTFVLAIFAVLEFFGYATI